jgi:hypothetical protein
MLEGIKGKLSDTCNSRRKKSKPSEFMFQETQGALQPQ